MLKKVTSLFMLLLFIGILTACDPYRPESTSRVPSEPSQAFAQPTTAATDAGTTAPAAVPTTVPVVHIHSYFGRPVAPSCTEGGYVLHVCECGDQFTDSPTDPLGHSWSDWIITIPPTETEEGLQERKCTLCQAVGQQLVEKLPQEHTHSYDAKVTAPSCTKDGYTVHTCVCGDQYTDNLVKALGHSFTDYRSNGDATCIADGTKTAQCDRCDDISTIADAGSATGHVWGRWTIEKEPTTTSEGLEIRYCTLCATKESRTLEKLPEVHVHAYTAVVVPPTCTKEGYTRHTCACGDSYQDEVTPVTDHSWSAWVTTKEPTLTSEGIKTRSCGSCGATDSCIIEKLPEIHQHQYSKEQVPATCTESGYTLYICSCGARYQDDVQPATGHNWGEWVTTKEPTVTTEGVKTRACDYCGATDSCTIEKLPEIHEHLFTEEKVAATCTESGYTRYTCSCGYSYQDDVQPPTSHNWGEWVTTKEPTVTSEGVKTRTCGNCGAKDSCSIEKLPEIHEHGYTKKKVAATCTEGGYTLYTCECGDSYKEVTSEPKGHTWGTWYVSVDPTTTSEGQRERSCKECEEKQTGTVDMLQMEGGFVFVYWTETIGRNMMASVIIKGQPGETYKIQVHYKSGVSSAKGLEDQVADENGYVTWNWKIGPSTAAGNYKIVVSGGEDRQTVYFTVVVE